MLTWAPPAHHRLNDCWDIQWYSNNSRYGAKAHDYGVQLPIPHKIGLPWNSTRPKAEWKPTTVFSRWISLIVIYNLYFSLLYPKWCQNIKKIRRLWNPSDIATNTTWVSITWNIGYLFYEHIILISFVFTPSFWFQTKYFEDRCWANV